MTLEDRIAAYLASPKAVSGWIREVDDPYLPLLREAQAILERMRVLEQRWWSQGDATSYTLNRCAAELAAALVEPQP